MAAKRESQERYDEYQEPRRRKRSRFGRLKWMVMFFAVGCLLLVAFAPQLATSSGILNSVIDKYGGLQPLKLEIGSAKAGWFSPVKASQVHLRDQDGKVLAKIGAIETEKSLLSWLTDSSDLGKIVIRNMEAAVVAYDGTTNLEEALKPLLEQYATTDVEPEEVDTSSTTTEGTIEILDSRFVLADASRPEQWMIAVHKLSLSLPTADQVTGPIDLSLAIGEASNIEPEATGKLSANVKQVEGNSFEIRAKADQIPVDFWHVIRARVPTMPVEDMRGNPKGSMCFETQVSTCVQVYNHHLDNLCFEKQL